MSRMIDLTGKQFGWLTVLHRSDKKASVVYWTCRCTCGKVIDVAGNNLKRGHTVSCGCRRTAPYIGKRFGKLTVLEKTQEYVQHGSTKSPLWKCRCDCGNITLVRMDSLTSGTTQSCGCSVTEKVEKMRGAAGYVGGTQLSRIKNIPRESTNSCGVVGVYYDRENQKWVSRLTFQGKRYYLGRYDTLEKAVEARQNAEAEYFGTFLEELTLEQDKNKDHFPIID